MANPEHLEILKQGSYKWNRWREKHPEIIPDLRDADLKRANLNSADLSGADLRDADFYWADLTAAKLIEANLDGANLGESNLTVADLSGANLQGVHLFAANLTRANLTGADLSFAMTSFTAFGDNDLSAVQGLDMVEHFGPSTIGIDTIYKSGGKISEVFLRGCGVPEQFITFTPSLVGAVEPFQYHSCFISYSTKDEEFAKRLHSRLRDAKVRVWFAPEDIKGGVKLYDQIERAIQFHDRLLIVLSENSLQSEWVMTEIRKAREVEKRENRRKLFPIRLTDFEQIRKWSCPDADSGKDLAIEVREYFIPDFSNWKDHDSFEKAFERLLRDLREAEDGKGAEVSGAQFDPQIEKAIEDGEIIVDEQSHTYEILIDCTGAKVPFNERDRTRDVLARQKRMSDYRERLQRLGYMDKQTKPANIDELRSRLTDEQRIILNTISRHFLDDGREREWIRSGFLQHLLGEGYDEGKIHSIIMPLGGSVVYESTFVGSGTRYVLTSLGLLLTEHGEEMEIVLAKYLEYVCQRFIDTHGAGERVALSDIAKKQGLTSDQLNLLRRVLIWFSDFYGGGGNDEYGPPHCVDKLVKIADLRAYIREHEFSKFDPRIPIVQGPLGYRGGEMPDRKGLQLEGEGKQLAPVVYISRQNINFQGDYMSDTYNVSGQAGAVGQNAHAHDMTFNQLQQVGRQIEQSMDLAALATELEVLRQALKKESATEEHDSAVADVGKAKKAAEAKDSAKLAEYLKSAGKWAFDVATKIGVSLASEALKHSMGMK